MKSHLDLPLSLHPVLTQVSDSIKTAIWVGDCFIYNNAMWRLNYCVAGEVTTMYHLDRPMYLLGYLATQNRVFLIDKWVHGAGAGLCAAWQR